MATDIDAISFIVNGRRNAAVSISGLDDNWFYICMAEQFQGGSEPRRSSADDDGRFLVSLFHFVVIGIW